MTTKSADELLAQVYHELRRLAAARLAGEPPGHTLQATALVHEAWLKIGADGSRVWNSRTHFFATAAEAMRQILIDRARARRAAKNGGGLVRVDLDDPISHIAAPVPNDEEVLAVHEALDRLAAHDPRKAELVKLRYFVGLTIEQAAEILSISVPTANRDWRYAKAWLACEIKRTENSGNIS